ncbi:MAG: glycosyl transferase family 90 [Bacteroidales bacterium]|nr:glycosyl transferase family 90 [Bacteroidales bacterium]
MKFFYYLKACTILLTPHFILKARKQRFLQKYYLKYNNADLQSRLDYYNKLKEKKQIPQSSPTLAQHKLKNVNYSKVYYFDSYEYTRYFPKNLNWKFAPGDITDLQQEPTIVKSRPISQDNENSVLLKLNKIRHFIFVKDKTKFEDKIPKILFRGAAHGKPNRQMFIEKWIDNPICDIKDTAKDSINPPQWQSKPISIKQQLRYKYIMAIEGNDVASNLKWIMSSNSIAVMPRPKYETWFMEGCLIPNYHYIEIKDDFSDLIERVNYYEQHPEKAKAIIKNANEYVKPFKDKKREKLLSILVLKRYFEKTERF